MQILFSAITIGLVLGLLSLGVYITYRIFDFPDITTDGSFTTGAAIAALLITGGWNPVTATLIAAAGGMAAGLLTGVLSTKFRINRLLAGILVMTALYTCNLRIMQQPNINLLFDPTLVTYAESAAASLIPSGVVNLFGSPVTAVELVMLGAALVIAAGAVVGLRWFFQTHLGMAMRAVGDNEAMIRALGVSVDTMYILGIMLANGLVAFSGAIFAQYQGYADIQMGIGMVVIGLASVIIGQTFAGTRKFSRTIAATVLGTIVLRLLIAVVTMAGLDQQDMKLITAVFVVIALVAPRWIGKVRESRHAA